MSVRPPLVSLVFHPEHVTDHAIGALDERALLEEAAREMVVPQVSRAVPGLRSIHQAATSWMFFEELERRAVSSVLDQLRAVPLLFFKGSSLAYSLYERPSDRMRLDWDILIAGEHREQVERVLLDSGFTKFFKKPGRIRVRQDTYSRDAGGSECRIDLHTGLFNAPVLAERITFADLYERSVPLTALHPNARGVCLADALVLACLHRLVHHAGETRLIWDYEIRLLLLRLEGDAGAVVRRCSAWKAGPLVAREIKRVMIRSGDDLPFVERLIKELSAQPSDLLAYAADARSLRDEFLMDWRVLGWGDRAQLLRETFMPDPEFVQRAAGTRLPLPLLYVRRLAKGAAGWFRRRRPPADSDRQA